MADEKDQNSIGQNWAGFGKGVGRSFSKFGKAVVKSVKVGAEKFDEAVDDDPNREKSTKPTGLKESWTDFGKTVGKTGSYLGKAISSTADKVVGDDQEPVENPTNNSAKEHPKQIKWTCTCGAEVEGNFCYACGAKRPE